MKRPNIKKAFAILTFISLALAASLTYGLMNGHPASAKSASSPSNISAAPAAISSATTAAAQITNMPRTAVYALDTDNTLFVLWPGTTSFVRLVRIPDAQAVGNFIGIDFRVSDGNNNRLYAQTDRGRLYTISLLPGTLGQATLVSTLTPQFPSGYQSLMDFNPVIDAIRDIGSDTSNYAVVKDANGILSTTAVQTSLTYNPNDVNKGVTPRVSAGSYNNNFIGATATIFYAIDRNLDSLVTIDPATDPNETISPVPESIDVYVRRRTRVDWSASGGDKFADCPQYTSARGRAATGSGRIDRHERVGVVINCIENSGSGADKVVVV